MRCLLVGAALLFFGVCELKDLAAKYVKTSDSFEAGSAAQPLSLSASVVSVVQPLSV